MSRIQTSSQSSRSTRRLIGAAIGMYVGGCSAFVDFPGGIIDISRRSATIVLPGLSFDLNDVGLDIDAPLVSAEIDFDS
jgi:hypothetical protein